VPQQNRRTCALYFPIPHLAKLSFSLECLDLSDLGGVRAFAAGIKSKIDAEEIPGLVGGGIVNSAAYMTL
jgi:hypothetical protein